MRRIRRFFFLVVVDAVFATTGLLLSFLLRFEFAVPLPEWEVFGFVLPILVVCRIAGFWMLGVYRGLVRYASVADLLNIAKGTVVGTIGFILGVVFLHGLVGFPRSVFIAEPIVTFLLVGGARFVRRMWHEMGVRAEQSRQQGGSGRRSRTLIIGAGDAGVMVLRELKTNPRLNLEVVGFIDDDPHKQKMRIQGVPVIGTCAEIVKAAAQYDVDEIIIALPSVSRRRIQEIVEECRRTSARVKIVPELGSLIDGRVTVNSIRDVDIEDLLGREQVELDSGAIRAYLAGKRVLVTGAGGSIGSEICRQLMRFGVAQLFLFCLLYTSPSPRDS